MKRLSKILILLMVLAVCLSFPLTAHAHPGKTDGNGGHTDHDTGEYHYHHGYPAHSHYDMDGDGTIDCPYDFDDQTSSNISSNSSDSYRSSSIYSSPTLPEAVSSANQDANYHLSFGNMFESLFLILFSLLLGAPIFFILYFLTVLILRIPSSWFWKLVNPKLSEDQNDRYSTVSANIILIIILYIYFLQPLVSMFVDSPDTLAAAIVLLGIVLFCGILALQKNSNKLDAMSNTVNTLKAENKERYTLLEQSKAEQAKAMQRIAFFEEQYYKKVHEFHELEIQNKLLSEQLNSLQSSLLPAQSLKDESAMPATQAISDILPKDVYLINGNIPVKGEITDRKPFGDYTVYVAKTGHCYHSDYLCGSGYLKSTHIFKVYGKKTQCLRCRRALPDGLPSWYAKNRDFFF